MEVLVLPDAAAVARRGADLAIEALRARQRPVLLAATGNSPQGLYRELAERRRRGEIDLDGLRVAQLDEYLDLRPDDRRSLLAWLARDVVEPLGVAPRDVIALARDGVPPDVACREYAAELEAAGGVDLAVLGLGPNGHLGFNEPPSGPNDVTREVQLAADSVKSNARYWEGEPVPDRAVTAGMDVIVAARRILLIVIGDAKRVILGRVLSEPIGPLLPASFLRMHPVTTLLADEAAFGRRGP